MNKNRLLLIVSSLILFSSNYSGAELGLFVNEVDKEEIIKSRLDEADFEFSDEEIRCSSGVLAVAFKALKSEDLARLVNLHSQWKAVDSILTNSRIMENVPNLGSGRITKTILVAEKINKKATVALLHRQLHSAAKNGEITFLALALKWMNSNNIEPSLNEAEWHQLMRSTAFNRDVVRGPSLKIHILIRDYESFVSKHKIKSQLSPVTLKVIQSWENDPFKTGGIASKLAEK